MSDRRVYRPVGPRVVAIVAGACLVALFVAVAATLPPEVRAAFTPLQTGTLLLFLGVFLAVLWGIARSRVVVDDDGVHVTNGYRTHHLAWADILDVAYPDGAPWPTLATRDDRRVMMLGLPSSDGTQAREAVWYLRERLLAGGDEGPDDGET
ncbi:PH (Pleckstrin Homology) domain-containing protein [Mumia flava]|uniref:PH (Pleckstrin Homology) domain-containing protein n=1 Tax=Mumia flava TaxID=1348852 RepID=A0A2M9BCZ8_9ACTN|nr:PH (Pleckstrin Homology) domain-containing protein [Mumia flava]